LAVLVTGGAGYIGGHMVLALLDEGQQPVVIDNMSTGFRWSVPAGVAVYEGDCGDQKLLSQVMMQHHVKAVLHFAGSIIVPESVSDPLGYYLNNTVNSRALIASAVRAGVREFVFSSTAAVYGNPSENPVSEAAALNPISPYGSSKLMTETMLRDTACAHDLRFVALRYFNVAGADPKGRWGQATAHATHLIKIACEVATGERAHLEVFGDDYPTPDGTCVRDYIHVTDLVSAHLLALNYLAAGEPSIALNCGYGRGYSVLEVIDAVRRVSGKELVIRRAPRRAGDPPNLVAKADKIRTALGWTPALDDLDTIIAHALAWQMRLKDRRGSSSDPIREMPPAVAAR